LYKEYCILFKQEKYDEGMAGRLQQMAGLFWF